MTKISGKKLALNVETLRPLDHADLEGVNGATGGAILRTIVQVSKYACTTVTSVASHPTVTCK